MREFTKQELNAVAQAEQQLREQGLILDNEDGKEAADHNAERVSAFFELNRHVPVTVESVLAAVQQMRDQLRFKLQEQVQFERLFNNLGQDEQRAYKAFRQSGLIDDHHNGAMLLGFLAGRKMPVDHSNLVYALKGIAPQLHWEQREQVSSGRPGHEDDGKGFLPEEKNPRYRNGKLNHAYDEPGSKQAVNSQLNPSEARWREMAEALRGNTHSKNAELQRIHGRSWRETYELRKRALNANPAIVTRMGAG